MSWSSVSDPSTTFSLVDPPWVEGYLTATPTSDTEEYILSNDGQAIITESQLETIWGPVLSPSVP